MNNEIKTTAQIEQELKECSNLNQVAKVLGISYYALIQMIGKIGVSKEEYLENIDKMYVELHGEKHFHPRSIVNGGRLPRELSSTFIEVIRDFPINEREKALTDKLKSEHGIELEEPTAIEFDGVKYSSLHEFAKRFDLSERELRYITGRKGVTDNYKESLINYFSNEGRTKFLTYSAGKIIGSTTMNPYVMVQELVEYGFIKVPASVPPENYISAIVNSHINGFSGVFREGAKIEVLNLKFDSLSDMLNRLGISLTVFMSVSTQVDSLVRLLQLTGSYKHLFTENTAYLNGIKFNYPIEVASYLSISLDKLNELLENGTKLSYIVSQFALADSSKLKLKDESTDLRTQLADAKEFFTSIGVPFALALKVSKKMSKTLAEIRDLVEGFEIEIEGSTLRTFRDISDVLGVDFEQFVNAVNDVKDIKDEDERCFTFIEKCL